MLKRELHYTAIASASHASDSKGDLKRDLKNDFPQTSARCNLRVINPQPRMHGRGNWNFLYFHQKDIYIHALHIRARVGSLELFGAHHSRIHCLLYLPVRFLRSAARWLWVWARRIDRFWIPCDRPSSRSIWFRVDPAQTRDRIGFIIAPARPGLFARTCSRFCRRGRAGATTAPLLLPDKRN